MVILLTTKNVSVLLNIWQALIAWCRLNIPCAIQGYYQPIYDTFGVDSETQVKEVNRTAAYN